MVCLQNKQFICSNALINNAGAWRLVRPAAFSPRPLDLSKHPFLHAMPHGDSSGDLFALDLSDIEDFSVDVERRVEESERGRVASSRRLRRAKGRAKEALRNSANDTAGDEKNTESATENDTSSNGPANGGLKTPETHTGLEQTDVENDAENDAENSTFVPGNATIFVKTYGCSHNRSDSEVMSGLLSEAGYSVTLDDDLAAAAADVWVINSCSVKNPSELAFAKEIAMGRSLGKKVVLAGCVAQHSPSDPRWNGLSVVGVQQIDRVVEAVEATLQGNSIQLLRDRTVQTDSGKKKSGGAPLALPKIRRNPLIEIIPINTGCLNTCTYCKTKHARGNLGSYPPDEILARIHSVAPQVAEIWLTSEDTGAYGHDLNLTIADLLDSILPILPSYPWLRLRLGMGNPPHLLPHIPRIAAALNHPQFYAFLHLPVQSGSSRILNLMKREYTRDDFIHLCTSLRALVPNLTIATDIISGFPDESPEDHADSLSLVKELAFPILHISQFFPRPGTPAARMSPVVPQPVKKQRTRELTALFESFDPYASLLGATLRGVLVTDVAKDGKLIGHSMNYTQVLIPAMEGVMGKLVDVLVEKTGRWSVEGRVLEIVGQGPPGMIAPDKRGKGARVVKRKVGAAAVENPGSEAAGRFEEPKFQGSGIGVRLLAFFLLALLSLVLFYTGRTGFGWAVLLGMVGAIWMQREAV